ncbi:MAG: hypothetical protein ACO3JL_12940, partial [Myxococcota bacterium]
DVTGWTAWANGAWDPNRGNEPPMLVNGILCPSGAQDRDNDGVADGCSGERDSTDPDGENASLALYYDVIAARGGVAGAIAGTDASSYDNGYSAPADCANDGPNCAQYQANVATTIEAILNVVAGQVAPYELSDDPISATVKVAIGQNASGQCSNASLPRSRVNGFSYDAATKQVAFWGSCRPEEGTDIAVSYRTWIDLTGDPNGTAPPCGGPCADPLICVDDQCVCPSDCGGGLGPQETCNPATCTAECLDDCGGTCGAGETCNTSTCSCQCECIGQSPPEAGFVCDLDSCQWTCPADGCDASLRPGPNWVCGADCTWECPDNCGVADIGTAQRCNKQTCEVECAPDCNAQCSGYLACNNDEAVCGCECREDATCGAGYVFDSDPGICGCTCDATTLDCSEERKDLESCLCRPCTLQCDAGFQLNADRCECVPFDFGG